MIAIVVLGVCVILNISGVAKAQGSDPFISESRDGYETVTVNQAYIKIPSEWYQSNTVKNLDELEDDTSAYNFVTDEGQTFFTFDKYIVNIQHMNITKLNDMTYNCNEFERLTGIRIVSKELIASGDYHDTKKEVYSCNAEVMLNDMLYANFTGYFSIFQNGQQSYFAFAGINESVEKKDKAMEVANYIALSADYQNYDEAVNPNEKIEGSSSINYAEQYDILSDPIVNLNEYGYFKVINKGQNVEEVDIAGRVRDLLSGEDAEVEIKKEIKNTIYKTLDKPQSGYEWHMATIDYLTLGYDMTTVPPSIPISICDKNAEFVDSQIYTLSTDYQNNKICIFFELPKTLSEYRITLGEPDGILNVRNTENSNSKEKIMDTENANE